MPISASDIQYVFSGGTYNSDPSESLGGDPSLRVIWGTNNNLFDDITPNEAADGATDYRCFYIVNNHATDAFYDTRLFIESDITGGADIQIGIAKDTDVQQVVVSGISEGGSLTLAYEGTSVVMNWNLQLSQWAKNLQDALNALESLDGVIVNASEYPNNGSTRDMTRVFEVRYEGNSNYRYHTLLTLVSNNIVGSPTVQIIKLKNGCPINSIAAKVDGVTIEPYGITWSNPTPEDPILIGTLQAGDQCPVWIARTVAAGTGPQASDGLTLQVLGRPFA